LSCKLEKPRFLRVLETWSHETLSRTPLDRKTLEKLLKRHPDKLPKVQIVTTANMETLIQESSEFRKKVRGEAVGRLG
jgi:hypothetical protein